MLPFIFGALLQFRWCLRNKKNLRSALFLSCSLNCFVNRQHLTVSEENCRCPALKWFLDLIAVNWGALAIEPKDAAISQSATTWPYPQPPFDWHIDDLWAFIGTHTINGSYPPDNVPDPAITYGSQPYPSSITISRNRKSLWGDWDQVRS